MGRNWYFPDSCQYLFSLIISYFLVVTILMWMKCESIRFPLILRVWLIFACAILISVRLLCIVVFDRNYELRHKVLFWVSSGLFVFLDIFLIIWTLLGTLWYQDFISSQEGKVSAKKEIDAKDRWELPICFVVCDIITLACTALISNRLIALCMVNNSRRVIPDAPTSRLSMRSLQESLNPDEIQALERRVQTYDKEEDETCSICFEILAKKEKTLQLPECGHVFHSECLFEWVRRKAVCPYCRNNISEALGRLSRRHKVYEKTAAHRVRISSKISNTQNFLKSEGMVDLDPTTTDGKKKDFPNERTESVNKFPEPRSRPEIVVLGQNILSVIRYPDQKFKRSPICLHRGQVGNTHSAVLSEASPVLLPMKSISDSRLNQTADASIILKGR